MTVRDAEITGKRVIMRVDFNVPLDDNGNITNDMRIKETLPTIKYILDKNAKLILMSHLGDPKGKYDSKLKMDPVAKRLSELLGKNVVKTDACVGPEVEKTVAEMKHGDVVLLENVRFNEGEEAKKKEKEAKEAKEKDKELAKKLKQEAEKMKEDFARQLAGLADVYVNDAFGTAHRAHASTSKVALFLPAYAGLLMEKEIETLGRVLNNPKKPLVVVFGGAKVSSKIGVIKQFIKKADAILIGGKMAYSFLKAQGHSVGTCNVDDEDFGLAKATLEELKTCSVDFVLPVDHVAGKSPDDENTKVIDDSDVPDGVAGFDIGPKTIELFKSKLKDAKMVIWNGPLGFSEKKQFANGTDKIANFMSQIQAETIVGGGDSVAAIEKLGIKEKFGFVSTGGGASLEFLEGKSLPGISAIKDK